jgi:hypothetical protein
MGNYGEVGLFKNPKIFPNSIFSLKRNDSFFSLTFQNILFFAGSLSVILNLSINIIQGNIKVSGTVCRSPMRKTLSKSPNLANFNVKASIFSDHYFYLLNDH